MLEIKQISKTFFQGTPNENKALDSVSLRLEDGEFVTVIGSNGAGKSTLFNAISGFFQVDSGAVFMDGRNITYEAPHKRAMYIGRVFQDPMKGTAPNMTIEENLALSYSRSKERALGFALRKKNVKLFQEALADFGMNLENRMKNKVGLLSGGQRQALTLLMCTLVTPKLLLLDEHTAALDPAMAEKIMKITNAIVRKHRLTTIMVTHNIGSALHTGNRTAVMDSGRIILDIAGSEREKMTVPDLMKLYQTKSNKALDNDRILLG